MTEDDIRNPIPGPVQSVDIAASPVLVKGGYQILRMDGPETSGESRAYSLLTLAGQPVRQEMSLDEAKVWLDRIATEGERPPLHEPVAITRRIKR